MFQLIIAVIAIVIVAILALAAIFFGGPAFNQGDTKAKFAQYLQEGTQIQAGYKFGEATSGYVPSGSTNQQFQSLVDNKYLSDIPGGGWTVQDSVLYRPLKDTKTCGQMNRVQGKYDPAAANMPTDGCPVCSDTTYSDWYACQSDTAIVGDPTTP